MRGFLVRHDISKLDVALDPQRPERKGIVQLGHEGRPCHWPTGDRGFTVVDANGVHSTRIAFCGCQEQPPNKARQLLRSGLFPASITQPYTAFTINMLKQFHLHNVESKKSAYDYMKAIRRLSDNAFTADVAVSSLNKFVFFCLLRRARIHMLLFYASSGYSTF